jgi:hypothetical protein
MGQHYITLLSFLNSNVSLIGRDIILGSIVVFSALGSICEDINSSLFLFLASFLNPLLKCA